MKKALLVVTFAFIFSILACQNDSAKLVNLSPTEIYKLQDEATRKKDAATVKQTLTKESVEMMNDIAKKSGTTFEEVVNKIPNKTSASALEFRNEKIDGEIASVEVKNSSKNDWSPVHFRKEEGVWKVDMVKLMSPAK